MALMAGILFTVTVLISGISTLGSLARVYPPNEVAWRAWVHGQILWPRRSLFCQKEKDNYADLNSKNTQALPGLYKQKNPDKNSRMRLVKQVRTQECENWLLFMPLWRAGMGRQPDGRRGRYRKEVSYGIHHLQVKRERGPGGSGVNYRINTQSSLSP
ncbi:hypothetical protein GOODEAATRI_000285 [Goodea atripinnis]|uniref:Uncharacterized protein n=1 Tax=Goodea atripinnis TaxID=208336 RepID=A0ABV0NRS8_9TELE